MTKEYLKNELCFDNLEAYSLAMLETYSIIEKHIKDYKNILIPSRGSYPFFLGACLCNQMANGNAKCMMDNSIILPFTADSLNNSTQSADVRSFWVQVYKGILGKKEI